MNNCLRSFLLAISISTLGILSGCSLLDTVPVTIPAYIYVPGLGFHTEKISRNEGDSSSNFVDVWMYNEGTTLGNIGLPAQLPIQKTGLVTIEMDAGIKKTGQDDYRVPYPFTARQRFTRLLKANQSDTFYPYFNYLPSTQFSIVEGFENNNFQLSCVWPKGDSLMKVNATDSLNMRHIILGRYCGKLQMADSNASSGASFVTSDYFPKTILQPSIASPVYLEMDYKSNLSIDIILNEQYVYSGSYASKQIPIISCNPTNGGWNKIYVCLDDDMTGEMNDPQFQIVLQVNKNVGLSPDVYFDNIKLLHF